MAKNFERTQNPELWEQTKVGNNTTGEQELIDNLNRFVEDLNIVGVKDHNLRGNRFKNEVNPWAPDISNMDHFAFFKRAGELGYVAIFSPYGGVKEDARTKIEEYGYQRYETNLYALDSLPDFMCPTMYKLIPYNEAN
jgi:hypothetical protein